MIPDEIIPAKQLNDFLQKALKVTVSDIEFIAKGVFSQAFSFLAGDKEYICRVGSSEEGFRKDEFAYYNLSGYGLPIPEVLKIDRYDDDHIYCISEKLPGITLNALAKKKEGETIPAVISTLDRLRQAAVPADSLYGTLDRYGQGQFKTWQEFLTNFTNWEYLIHKGAKESFRSIDELYDTSFLDQVICEKCKTAIVQLAPFCPEEKYYVHGDFGFGNVLTDGQKITGILDWSELLCGDFLVDIAALDYSHEHYEYSSVFTNNCLQKNISLPNVEERMLCYKIIMALKSMYLEANRNQRDWYEVELRRLEKMGFKV